MPTSPAAPAIADRLRQMMKDRGITQTQLGETLAMTQPQVSKRLTGRIPWKLHELALVARLLDCKLGDIVSMDVR